MATQLDLVDAQFVGFSYARNGYLSIIGLIDSMGMTKSEWKKWNEKYSTAVLTDSEIKEIDEYFEKRK
jgi:hypothetical protein